MRDSRQITVLRSLFRTLHPGLTSGLKSGLEPAKRMLTGAYQRDSSATESAKTADSTPVPAAAAPRPTTQTSAASVSLPPLPRSLTDEHLVSELENATRQFELKGNERRQAARAPVRTRRHYSRDTLLSLLEEAKVRIQVLETELELARGTDEHIPLLTEEWGDDLPSTYTRKPD